MKNVMIIKWQANNYFVKYIKTNNIYQLYNTDNYEKVCNYMKTIGFLNIPLGKWTKKVKNADMIVFFDSFFNYSALKYVKENNPDARVCLYYWNKMNDDNSELLKLDDIDDFYTFDPEDAEKYGIKYNEQFYTTDIKLKNKRPKYDVCFLGRDKGRTSAIEDAKKHFDDNNLNSDIRIITSEKDFISYKKYLKMIENSKCILDIVSNNQKGTSLRGMESLFFKKKLITNNSNIANYDFYNKNNIFIIGKDNWKNISKFINSNYEEIDQDIVLKYDFKNWIKRFEK